MENTILNTAEPIDYSREVEARTETENTEKEEKRDNSKNFLIDSGLSMFILHIENTTHSDEFVQKMVEKGIYDFNYMFPNSVGKDATEFTGIWNHGEIRFVGAVKHGICVGFYIEGELHNNYVLPYDIAYQLVPAVK